VCECVNEPCCVSVPTNTCEKDAFKCSSVCVCDGVLFQSPVVICGRKADAWVTFAVQRVCECTCLCAQQQTLDSASCFCVSGQENEAVAGAAAHIPCPPALRRSTWATPAPAERHRRHRRRRHHRRPCCQTRGTRRGCWAAPCAAAPSAPPAAACIERATRCVYVYQNQLSCVNTSPQVFSVERIDLDC
jgi:hypothetical protein